jgi:hypothetical protein
VADILRIGWPPWFGITGRHAPDYADARRAPQKENKQANEKYEIVNLGYFHKLEFNIQESENIRIIQQTFEEKSGQRS